MRKWFVVALCLLASQAVFGQSSSDEMSVEDVFLNASPELVVIREFSRGANRYDKETALEYIGDYIGDPQKDDKGLCVVLESLALDGIQNRVTENGRLMNNFPEIRAQAVRYLGQLGTEDARASIKKVMWAEVEPNVIYEAIQSLRKLGPGDDPEDTLVYTIWVFNYFDASDNPDNRVAAGLIDLCRDYYNAGVDMRNPNILAAIIKISENPQYTYPVRQWAKTLAKDIRTGGK